MTKNVQEIIRSEAEALLNIPTTDAFNKAIEKIHKAVHRQGGKVVVSGMGKSGDVARYIADMLSGTGTSAIYLNPANAQHGDLGKIQPKDVLLLVSNSGKTRETVELYKLVKDLHPRIGIIAITGNLNNEFDKSVIAISTGHLKEVCPLGLAPITFTTCAKTIGDVLVVLMMKKIKFTTRDYNRLHPGGHPEKVPRHSPGHKN